MRTDGNCSREQTHKGSGEPGVRYLWAGQSAEGEVFETDPVNLCQWWLATNQRAVVKKEYTKRDAHIFLFLFFPQKNKIHSPYETWKLQTGTEAFPIQYSSDYINIIPYIELKITIIILFKKKNPPNLHTETRFLQNLTKENPSKPSRGLEPGTILSVSAEGPGQKGAELGLNTRWARGIAARGAATATGPPQLQQNEWVTWEPAHAAPWGFILQRLRVSWSPRSPPKAVKCWLKKKKK